MTKHNYMTKSAILSQSFNLYRQAFNKLWPIALFAAIFVNMLLYITPVTPMGEKFNLSRLVVSVFAAFISYFFGAVMLKIIALKDEKNAMNDAFNICVDKVFEILLAGIAVYVLVFIGFLLLVIPGIYLSFVCLFVLPFLILDNLGVKQSFISSWYLVKGKWWHVTLSYTFAILIPIFFTFVLIIASSFFLPNLVKAMVFIAIKTLIYPYIIVVIYVLFNDLKQQPCS